MIPRSISRHNERIQVILQHLAVLVLEPRVTFLQPRAKEWTRVVAYGNKIATKTQSTLEKTLETIKYLETAFDRGLRTNSRAIEKPSIDLRQTVSLRKQPRAMLRHRSSCEDPDCVGKHPRAPPQPRPVRTSNESESEHFGRGTIAKICSHEGPLDGRLAERGHLPRQCDQRVARIPLVILPGPD